MSGFNPDELRPWRLPLWNMLLQVAQARCKGGPNEDKERDAAVALGLAPLEPRHGAVPENVLRAQDHGAAVLRWEIEQRTGERMATSLREENVYRCSDTFADRCPARERFDCPRHQGHAPPLGQRQMWDEEDAR